MDLLQQINPIVYRIKNQYFYGENVGVYLLNLSKKLILFDLPTHSKELHKIIASYNKPVIALLSHGSCGIADGTIWQNELGIKVHMHEADARSYWLRMKPDVLYQELPVFDRTLEVIHTPGHTPGSICLLEKTTKTLFVGDTIGGTHDGKVRNFIIEGHNDNVQQRIESSKKLLDYDFESILPFHYEMILTNGKQSLQAFVNSL